MSNDEVLFEQRGRAGVIILNRPDALNALTLNMVRLMHPQLKAWETDDGISHVVVCAAGEKAFCAGGDIRALYDWGTVRDENFVSRSTARSISSTHTSSAIPSPTSRS